MPDTLAKPRLLHVDLFSGIGGFSLACDWLGIETVCLVEIDKFCQKVLKKHWPDVPIVEDINNVEEIKGIVTNATSQRLHQEENKSVLEGKGGGEFYSCEPRIDEQIVADARLLGQTQRQEQTAGFIQHNQTIPNAHSQREQQPERIIAEVGGRTLDRNQGTTTDSGSWRTKQGYQDSRQSCAVNRSGIKSFANTEIITAGGLPGGTKSEESRLNQCNSLILTAGFPCQPFSNAGRKRGANDHRYLWPQTLAVIESLKPDFIVLENVAGILNMVFPDSESGVASQAALFSNSNDEIADYRTICGGIERDLRQTGYETVWLVIPACSLGAPHRRDRVWIIAYAIGSRAGCDNRKIGNERGRTGEDRREGIRQGNGQACTDGTEPTSQDAPHAINHFGQSGGTRENKRRMANEDKQEISDATHADNTATARYRQNGGGIHGEPESKGFDNSNRVRPDWQENWYEVATRFCRVDDGLPRIVDRTARLKALGNAIVPAVAYEIIRVLVYET